MNDAATHARYARTVLLVGAAIMTVAMAALVVFGIVKDHPQVIVIASTTFVAAAGAMTAGWVGINRRAQR